MEMGQQVLNKDSNEVKRFIEVMEGISKMLNANSLIYRPILDGNRYITEQELSKALKITKRTLIEYRMNGKLPYYKIGGKILYKEQDIIDILERNKVLEFELHIPERIKQEPFQEILWICEDGRSADVCNAICCCTSY